MDNYNNNNNNNNNPNRDDSSSSYTFQSGPSLSLTTELQQGKEFARQLQMLLLADQPPSFRHHSNSHEVLVQRIITSFDRAASIAQQNEPLAAPSPPPQPPPPLGRARSDSPLSGGANSPRSEDSDPVNGDQDSRRRNRVQPRWTTRVQVSPETGFEGPPGDGYNWRKYGQKDILGANFPRAYYRCALKSQTNCPATKQVQRSDDPSLFEVTYRALHTCNQPMTNPSNYPSSSSSHQNQPPRSTETLISFTPPNNASFLVHQNTHQRLSANPNRGFHFQASSSAPTTATSAIMSATIGTTTSASATSSPINITRDFPFDQFDFDASEFFH